MKHKTDIAITGMGCLFPKSSTLKEYRRLLFRGEDGITDVPDTHWSPEDYFDKDPKKPDHVCCKRGGFLSTVLFDPAEFGIPPSSLEATDTSQLLGLVVAKMALDDAGCREGRTFNRDRTSVILGVTGTQELVIPLGARLGHPKWRKALSDSKIDPEKIEEIVKRISDSYVFWQENSFPGLLGNVVAGRISNRFDLGGTNCVVDAACASSMSAVHLAVMELLSGRSDMVITGGVDTLNDIFMHTCFSKTFVLSPTGDIRPFSKDADGTVLGEGIGMLVLKRLKDAEKDGDRIYAVIKAVGSSSDGKSQSIYAPRLEGQGKALRVAYKDAGIDPATVELIEAHGTGTKVGDVVEFQALNRLFSESAPNGNRCAIGSVKSMIGHTKAAAGAAGLIKAALSLYNKVLPPTLKVSEPDPNLKIDKSPFYLNTELRPWLSKKEHPRRSGVSAFGFGGSNFHVVLEEHRQDKSEISWDGSVEIVALSASTRRELAEVLCSIKDSISKGLSDREISIKAAATRDNFSSKDKFRLLLVLERPSGSFGKVFDDALSALEANRQKERWNVKNIFYGGSEKPGRIAFIFPGQGSQYTGMGRDLVCSFPEALGVLERADEKFKNSSSSLSGFIYPHPAPTEEERRIQEETLRRTDIAQPAIGAVSLAMLKILQKFGVKPDATCGHSFGELTALAAAGWIDTDTLIYLSISRGSLMASAGRCAGQNSGIASACKSSIVDCRQQDNGAMLAVTAQADKLVSIIEDMESDVILANRNSPTQGVLSGSIEAIVKAEKICIQKGFRTKRLSVSAAFHSSLIKDIRKPFMQTLEKIDILPTDIPVFSNTTGRPYPVDPSDAKRLLGEHPLRPVDFMGEIENLFRMGVDTFVEIGPGTVLTGLVRAILKGRNFQAIPMDRSSGSRSGIADLASTVCHLASVGCPVKLNGWEDPVSTLKVREQLMSIPLTGANYRREKTEGRSCEPQVADCGIKKRTPAPQQAAGLASKSINGNLQTVNRQIDSRSNRSIDRDRGVMAQDKMKKSDFVADALRVVQEGLKSMQALQMQTSEAHKKFLETQTEASRMLQSMMENTQRLAEASIGVKVSSCKPDCDVQRIEKEEEISAKAAKTSYERPGVAPFAVEAEPEVKQGILPDTREDVEDDDKGARPPDSIKETVRPQETPLLRTAKEIEESMLKVVSQLTGYPVEMLNPEMNIEADLGIDSIKRVEILSALEESMPGLPSIPPETVGSLRTLGQIAEYLAKNAEGGRPESEGVKRKEEEEEERKEEAKKEEEEKKQQQAQASDEGLSELYDSLRDKIDRMVVSIVKKPVKNGRRLSIPQGRSLFVTDDKTGLSEAIVDELRLFNIDAVHILPAKLKNKKGLPKAGGLIILPGRELVSKTGWDMQDSRFLKDAFAITSRIAPDLFDSAKKGGALFATVTRLDGAFGFNGKGAFNPLTGGLAGLAKTASTEWEDVCCHAIDVAPDWKENKEIAKAVVAELLNHNPLSPVEVGLAQGLRYELELKPSPYLQSKKIDIDIDRGDVVVVTGGARGVTAAAAHALAKHIKPTLLLLGRSPNPFPEPEWLVSLKDESAIKRGILEKEFKGGSVSPVQIEKAFEKYMANREISENLKRLEEEGAVALYYSIDIRDPARVKSILDDVRSTHGPVKGIIHGAGVIEDRLITDKTEKQFETVFDTKVKGLYALLEATREDELKYIILFSSVTARTGNRGQVDYAMANEVLNKVAQQESIRRKDCKTVSINWGPWDGGMVSSALKRQFTRNRIGLIPIDTGAGCMLCEMMGDKGYAAEVVVGANTRKESRRENRNLSLAFKYEVDVDRYPILKSHVLDRKPVVPFALMIEWLGHVALHKNPGLSLYGLDDVRLLKGIKLNQEKKMVSLLTGISRKKGSIFEVDVEIRDGINIKSGVETVHSTAKAVLTDRSMQPPSFDGFGHIGSKSYLRSMDEVYEKILFHGPKLHGIKKITGYSSNGMVALTLSAPLPAEWMASPLRSRWIGDPLVLDSAFQMAVIWCFEEMGAVSLPGYCASYRQYCSNFPSTGVTVVLEVKEAKDHKMTGDFTFLDSDNTVVARLTGYEAIVDTSLFKAFRTQAETGGVLQRSLTVSN